MLGGFFLWLALKNVDFTGISKSVTDINLSWFALFFLSQLIMHWFRTMRIRILLKPLGGIGYGNCFIAGSLGAFGLTVLPFRLGDLIRPAVIKQKEGISMTSALGCVAIERIFDGIVVSLMLFASLFYVSADSNIPRLIMNATYIGFAIFISGLAFILFADRKKGAAIRLIHATVGRISNTFGNKLETLVVKFIVGLKVLPKPKLILWYLGETIVYWVANALGQSALLIACGLSFNHIIAAGFILLGVQALGVMIPGAPAGIGPFEFFTMAALAIFLSEATVNTTGVVFTMINHSVLILVQVFFGALFLLAGHISFVRLVERARKEIA